MTRLLKIYLVVTAVLAVFSLVLSPLFAVLSLLFPVLQVLGLAVGTTPALFLYGVAFAVAWFLFRSRLGAPGAFLAGCAAVACLGVLLPLLVNDFLQNRVARARADDQLPSNPVELTGVLRIERGRDAFLPTIRLADKSERFACDQLCAAALFTPGIEAVVVAFTDDPVLRALPLGLDHFAATYRLQHGDCPEPLLPQRSGRFGPSMWPDAPALHTSHLLALSRGACLVFDDAIPAADWIMRLTRETLHGADWRLSLTDDQKLRAGVGSFDLLGVVTQNRLSLHARGIRILQQTQVDTQPLVAPPFTASVGGLFNYGFGWFRYERTDGGFKPIEVLARATRLRLSPNTSPTPTPTGEAVRNALAAALADTSLPVGAAGFALIGPLFDMMSRDDEPPDVRPGDAALIARVVADLRVRDDPFGFAEAVRALGANAEGLRAPMISRLLHARVPEDRSVAEGLGRALAYFPPGTFAMLTSDEERLLADPVRRRWATGLIERQADRGAAGVADLVGIVAQAYVRSPSKADGQIDWGRLDDVDAALRALCLIGPASGDGFARLAKVIEGGAVPQSVLNEHQWQFTLARLSGAVEGVTTISDESTSRQPHERRPWPALTHFKPEYCR